MTMTTGTRRTNSSRSDPLDVRSRLGQVKRRAPRRTGQWAAAVLFVALVVIGLVALFQSQSDRVEVLVVADSVPAGQVIKELAPIVGGRGGGKPDMAEGGGSQPEKLGEALESSYAIVEKLLK